MEYRMSYTKIKDKTKIGDFDDGMGLIQARTDVEMLCKGMSYFQTYRDYYTVKVANDEFALKHITKYCGTWVADTVVWIAVKKSKYWEFYKKNNNPESIYYNQFDIKYKLPIGKSKKTLEEMMKYMEKAN